MLQTPLHSSSGLDTGVSLQLGETMEVSEDTIPQTSNKMYQTEEAEMQTSPIGDDFQHVDSSSETNMCISSTTLPSTVPLSTSDSSSSSSLYISAYPTANLSTIGPGQFVDSFDYEDCAVAGEGEGTSYVPSYAVDTGDPVFDYSTQEASVIGCLKLSRPEINKVCY